MQDGIETELATARFGTTNAATARDRTPPKRARRSRAGNVKLRRRFERVLDAMSQKPSLKFPAACKGTAEVKAAYRFLDNEHVTFTAILDPHPQATRARIAAQEVVLIPQGTTELDRTRPHEVMADAGPLNDPTRVGFSNHVSLALTPQRLVLGVLDAPVWARDRDGFDKDARQERAERRAKPIEDKESFRWVQGDRAAGRVAAAAPQAQIVSIAESEGDIYEYILEARTVAAAPEASFLIRASQDRAATLLDPGGASAPEAIRRVREQLAGTPALAQRTPEIRRRDARSKDQRERKRAREARTAVVEIRAAAVTLRGPARPGGRLPDLVVQAVLVTEPDPPPDVEPVEWLLLTDLPIGTRDEVLKAVDYYTCRWQIGVHFRVLKSGCKVEESQLETAARFEPYRGLCLIVAWRVMHLMMLGRDCPESPCEIALDPDEWQAV
jgi:hypothetical protein